jgi:hypothetical protein
MAFNWAHRSNRFRGDVELFAEDDQTEMTCVNGCVVRSLSRLQRVRDDIANQITLSNRAIIDFADVLERRK